jgi:hypothetical protein
MSGSNNVALVESHPPIAKAAIASVDEAEVRLSLPETTMFIVGTSGALWALLFGAFKAVFG